ncbi:hypothetical protein FOXYS1_15808 [Fusarium oxysporum]|uniref:Uncharacterized protein n=1 Tax=Fusarium oxysporum TaxID=5507 RepID=A0A8H5DQM0_FUSOX|nr:hypothetical protein FOXYS1_15808 [Fusarium oxysporum]
MADNSTASLLAAQWQNPTGFLALLMIIGSPIIQVALAQATGPLFAPICFSFGWVSYAFSMIPVLAGEGRLMPTVDYPCKVFNLESGYARANRSWAVGRLLRDLEAREPLSSEAMSISIYKAVRRPPGDILYPGKTRWFGVAAILLQLVIAIIPCALHGDWGIIMITTIGTCLALSTAALPQWRVEKLACRLNSKKKIAITAGNGSRHVIVILGEGNGLDIEDLAAGEGPRHARPWQRFPRFAHFYDTARVEQPVPQKTILSDARERNSSISMEEAIDTYIKTKKLTPEVNRWRGLPSLFWITCILWAVFAIFWAGLLISVVALKGNAWYLVAVGSIGMIQNALVAAASRKPWARGMVLNYRLLLYGDKVMDTLMDLDCVLPGCGRALLKEFFPGDLSEDQGEKEWWDKKKKIDLREKGQAANHAQPGEVVVGRYNAMRYKEENYGKRYDMGRPRHTRGWKNGIK